MCGISACFDLRPSGCRESNRYGKSTVHGRNAGDRNCRIHGEFTTNGQVNAVEVLNGHEDTRTTYRNHLTTKLERSVESMRHRGPDAKGIWVSHDNSVGLAHVRLSTRDLSSAGNQPMHADDIHVVINGELYYDQQLRESLAKEYTFQSTSDSEMLIPLWKRYGPAFIDHLRGEFSLVIYDARTETLVVARDRFGVKPLHYGIFDGHLLVATQCKGVIHLLDSRESLRWDAVCLAQGGGHYGDRTLFDGIRKVPSGHMLVVRKGEEKEVRFEPYWQTRYRPNEGGTDDRPTDELVEELRSRLLEAVRLRVESSDVPVGILLSGGVDSSAVAGMAAHISRQRQQQVNSSSEPSPLPTCFTIGFPDSGDLDESKTASRTAEHLGLPIEKLVATEQILADEFDEACWLGESLMWDLQHIAKKALSRHISSRGLKVVLNGDGSDELFGGYPYFAADRLQEDDKQRAPWLLGTSSEQREILLSDSTARVPWFGLEEAKAPKRNAAADALGLPPAFCYLAVPNYHDNWLLPSVSCLGDRFAAIHSTFTPTEIKQMKHYHPLHRSMLAWHKTVLPNMVIAAISDGAEMAHAVESRPPFLDHVVAEFASTLSVDMLVHLDGSNQPVEKWIFREAVRPLVTDEVYRRRKQAFAAPFRWEIGGPLHQKLSSLLSRENIEALGFADWDKCGDLLERSFREKDQLCFRKAIWLAQIVSIGRQFGIQRWRPGAECSGRERTPKNCEEPNGWH